MRYQAGLNGRMWGRTAADGALRGPGVGRLVVALDPGVRVSGDELAAAWDGDPDARALGTAVPGSSAPGEFSLDPLSLVVIPLTVNVASSMAYDLVRKLMARLHAARHAQQGEPGRPDLELAEVPGRDGDLILIVRVRGTRS